VDLESYQPLHAARAELLRRSGDVAGASAAYARAISLSSNAREREELERRRASNDDQRGM
jgi:RNA polymerase sigma-70 factor (ECF subfamily)